MWYSSANFDETVFDDPLTFRVDRPENPHFAFGGGGPHMCLGAFLARMEISVLLEEMAKRGMSLQQASAPERSRSNFVHGVLSVDMTCTT